VLLGLMSSFCYAFGAGYVFSIEPRFLPAFSVTDLIFLFASSTSYLIFLVITFVPSAGLLVLNRHARGLFSGSAPASAPDGQADGESLPNDRAIFKVGFLIPFAITAVFSFLAVQDALDDTPFLFFTLPDFMTVSGGLLIMASLRPHSRWTAIEPLALFVYVLGAFYVFGAMLAYRDLVDTAADRMLPCAFIDSGPECVDLLAVASEVAVVRAQGRAVLVPRSRVRSIQARRPLGS
jgi:hypothetical protein